MTLTTIIPPPNKPRRTKKASVKELISAIDKPIALVERLPDGTIRIIPEGSSALKAPLTDLQEWELENAKGHS